MKYIILIVVVIIACYYYNIKIDVKVDKTNKHYQEAVSSLQKKTNNIFDTLKK